MEKDFCYEGGLREFVKNLNRHKQVLFPKPIYTEGIKDGILVEMAMQYNESYAENVYSFVNSKRVAEAMHEYMQTLQLPIFTDYPDAPAAETMDSAAQAEQIP